MIAKSATFTSWHTAIRVAHATAIATGVRYELRGVPFLWLIGVGVLPFWRWEVREVEQAPAGTSEPANLAGPVGGLVP